MPGATTSPGGWRASLADKPVAVELRWNTWSARPNLPNPLDECLCPGRSGPNTDTTGYIPASGSDSKRVRCP
eukprot:CAMPEP_0114267724 /NCGR_PEP_ID=MMETSP0058-20121206/25497_1 /TAXON_ID=36894 /ORGANISM="Pyramimonas parkeae, CCMP726" /LENGTH=71 /DNA_ID=CAMNT_0001385693 /DNA_START=224 /DNA_END=439 /DNA_ORIENTATION=-